MRHHIIFSTSLFTLILLLSTIHPVAAQGPTPTPDPRDWYMAGANPKRTSWVSEGVSGVSNGSIDWYRSIEGYIPQNVQIIAVNNVLYISTGKGLYALNATDGTTVWRYDTEMPMGHSPTVIGGTVYVGSYDKRLHAIDATTGQRKWVFQAQAGFNTNPVVVGDRVYAGNRDGYFYAVDANTGQLVWQYPPADQPPLGPIMFSPAYDSGVLYFASNDNYAYALNATTGALVWKSANKMPGESFQSWWPVVYKDNAPGGTNKEFVVFSGSSGYRSEINPGVKSTGCEDLTNGILRRAMFGTGGSCTGQVATNVSIGPTSTGITGPWPSGTNVMDAQRIIDFYEDNPHTRTTIYLNKADGTEYTFDSDGDGKAEYAPILHVGTKSGNIYPPIVRPAGNGYSGDIILQDNWRNSTNGWIAQGETMGWKVGTKYLGLMGFGHAVDEPIAISGGGNNNYRVLCCDRVGSPFWTYSSVVSGFSQLEEWIPDYNSMWFVRPNSPNDAIYTASYGGAIGSSNGTYNNHGDQNPIIPHRGRAFVHRGNSIIAFGPNGSRTKQPTIMATETVDQVPVPSDAELKNRLEREVLKIIAAGVSLKPGYHNEGMVSELHATLYQYFQNPGEMLATLSKAYPHLSESTQASLRTYLNSYFSTYFSPTAYSTTGWGGASRNYMDFPPEVVSSFSSSRSQGFPHFNAYALWLYAQNVAGVNVNAVYTVARNNMPTSGSAGSPWNHNQMIAGYTGYINLYTLAGSPSGDNKINTIQSQRASLLSTRAANFVKDSPENCNTGDFRPCRLNTARNFIYLTPELGEYLRTNANATVTAAFEEYNKATPYWFAAAFESTLYEGVIDVLHQQWLFQAKAYLYKGTPQGSKESLYKYLDTPLFKVGDLFYMNNLIDVIEADADGSVPTVPPTTPTPTPKLGDVDGNGSVNLIDLSILLSNFGKSEMQRSQGDLTGEGSVNIADLSQLLANFGQ